MSRSYVLRVMLYGALSGATVYLTVTEGGLGNATLAGLMVALLWAELHGRGS